MDMAERLAEESASLTRKVGCLFVRDGMILSSGINGTPPKWPSNVVEAEDGTTLPHVLHAEMGAVMKAAKAGVSLEGSTLYCTHSPCSGCAKYLVSVGISTVVYKEAFSDINGIKILKTMGIKVIKLT